VRGSSNNHFSVQFSQEFTQPTLNVLHHQSQDFLDPSLITDLTFDESSVKSPWQDFATDEDSQVTPGDGVLVRAVFSYEGQEEDELTFAKGKHERLLCVTFIKKNCSMMQQSECNEKINRNLKN